MAKLQDKGPLGEDDLYIRRECDDVLFRSLLKGEYCLVLAPRGIGKSNLLNHTSTRLQRAGVACVCIDLYGLLGEGDTPNDFLNALIKRMASDLSASGAPEPERAADVQSTPSHRLYHFIQRELLLAPDRKIVLLLDEVEVLTRTRSLPTDQVLGILRALYNERTRRPEFARFAVGLFGAIDAAELLSDHLRTPFNIGTAIQISDFSWAEMMEFRQSLPLAEEPALALLRAVFHNTGGHPSMSQHLLLYLTERYAPDELASETAVEAAITDLYFNPARGSDISLGKIDHFFRRQEQGQQAPQMLDLYARLLRGEAVPAAVTDRTQGALCLTGLARVESAASGQSLAIRNRIIARRFDAAWLQARLAERRLDERLRRWQASGQKETLLLEGEELAEARTWAWFAPDLSADEREFLLRSDEAERQGWQRRLDEARTSSIRRRKRGGFVIACLGLFFVFGAFGIGRRSAELAQAERRQAEADSAQRSGDESRHDGGMLSGLRQPAEPQLAPARRPIENEPVEAAMPPAKAHVTDAMPRGAQAPAPRPSVPPAKEALASPPAEVLPVSSLPPWVPPLLQTLESVSSATKPRTQQALADNLVQAGLGALPRCKLGASLHAAQVIAAQYLSDGSVFTASKDGRIAQWDGASGALRRTQLITPPASTKEAASEVEIVDARAAAVSKDIAIATTSGRLYVWPSNGDAYELPSAGTPRSALRVVISSEGRTVFSSDRSGSLLIQDRLSTSPPRRLQIPTGVDNLELSPNGRWLFAAGRSRGALASPPWSYTLVLPNTGGHRYLARFSPDGWRLLTIRFPDQRPQVWELPRVDPLPRAADGHTGSIYDAAYSPDGTSFVTVSSDRSALLWNGDGTLAGELFKLEAHEPRAVRFFSANQIVVGFDDGEIRWIDTAAPHRRWSIRLSPGPAARLDVSPDGHFALVTSTTPHAWQVPISLQAQIQAACALLQPYRGQIPWPKPCRP